MRILTLALMFSIPTFAAPQIKKKFLSAPTDLCHPVHCVKIAAGVAYYYDDKNKSLASGVLAGDTDLGGIKAPQGATIGFPAPGDHGTSYNFYLQTKSAQTWGGIDFAEGSKVTFQRFRVQADPTRGPIYVPIENGWVRVHGMLSRSAKVEGVRFARGELIVSATVDKGGLKDVHFQKGTVDENEYATLPATDWISLLPGDRLEVMGDRLKIEARAPRGFGAAGYFGFNADLWRASGKVHSIDLAKPITFNNIKLAGPTFFYENGKVRTGHFSEPQTVNGIRVNQADSTKFSGAIAFFENGSPATFSSRHVDDNAAFLPDAFADLPSEMSDPAQDNSGGGRLQFFYSPKGELRAVKREVWKSRATSYYVASSTESFTARDNGAGLAFALAEPGLELLFKARVGVLSKELEDYLTTGVWTPKKPTP